MCVTTFGKIQSDAKLLIESLRKLTRAMEQNKYTNFNQIKLSSNLTKIKKKKKLTLHSVRVHNLSGKINPEEPKPRSILVKLQDCCEKEGKKNPLDIHADQPIHL